MKRLIDFALLVFALALVSSATADDQPAAVKLVTEGNGRGAVSCVACHGLDGSGNAQAGYPRLAGFPAPYLLAQLAAFKAGTRKSEIMAPIASALNDEEARLASEYYAALDPITGASPVRDERSVDPKRLSQGWYLAEVGKWETGIPACVRCHGADGKGVPPDFPPLAGQHQSYIVRELQRWQAGERTNDPLGLMQAAAQGLTDEDIQAVAAWFATRMPGAPLAAGLERAERADPEVSEAAGQDDQAQRLQGYRPPDEQTIPNNKFGEAVLLGKRIFVETKKYAPQYVGNEMNCVNCHLNRGRRPESGSMGAAFVRYPRYREKNDKINTMQDRIQGCFKYSMNGTPPPGDSAEMTAIVAYFRWLAQGIEVADKPQAAGFAAVAKPEQAPSPERGAVAYAKNCAICHGANGQGTRIADRYQFPPLWGDDTYNWGAGMHRINTAAAFIKHNMPLGNPMLSLQEAWDVAAFINSQARPQDPRFSGNLAETKEKYHDHQCYYGETGWGKTLGAAGQ